MDQQSVILYLSRKDLSTVAINDVFVATFGAEAVNYPSMTRYLREAVFASSNPPDPLPRPEHQLDDSDQAIFLALADQPFASIRELSRLTHVPRTTFHRRLLQSLRFRVRHLQWVPFFVMLSKVRSTEAVTITFLIPERQEPRSWHDIVTNSLSMKCRASSTTG
jgi:hypothetical protein